MENEAPRFVPKVHPATRAIEPEDPMNLHATLVEGDAEVMLHTIVQEYGWLGWNPEQILGLFRDPFYPALHSLWCLHGEAGIRERIAKVLGRTGVLRFQATSDDEPDAAEIEPDVVQIGSSPLLAFSHPARNLTSAQTTAPGRSTREGGSHAEGL